MFARQLFPRISFLDKTRSTCCVSFIIAAALLYSTVSLLQAEVEFSPGSVIRGFELPQTDSQGNLRSKVRGSEAIVVSSNEIQIHGLTIDVYDQSQLTIQMQAPNSTFRRTENNLTVDKGIEITRPGFIMKAEKMQWSLTQNKGTFEKNVRVTIQSPFFKLP